MELKPVEFWSANRFERICGSPHWSTIQEAESDLNQKWFRFYQD